MSAEYFSTVKGARQGPVTIEELRLLAERQELKRSDLICAEGVVAWQPAGSMAEIFKGLPPDLKFVEQIMSPLPLPTEAQTGGSNPTFLARLPKPLRKRRTLALLASLIVLVISILVVCVKQSLAKAKWEREAPQREAQFSNWVQRNVEAVEESAGRNAGQKMFERRGVTTVSARTEAEIQDLAEYVWNNPNNEGLKAVCDGQVRPTTGYESSTAKGYFITAFVQGYLDGINAYNRRNQHLY